MAQVWYAFYLLKWRERGRMKTFWLQETAASRRSRALVVLEVRMTKWSSPKLPSSFVKCKRTQRSLLRKRFKWCVFSGSYCWVCVHTGTHVWGQSTTMSAVPRSCPSCVLRWGFSLAWNSPNWLASEPQKICLSPCFPVLLFHACFTVGFLGIKLGALCLQGKRATLSSWICF